MDKPAPEPSNQQASANNGSGQPDRAAESSMDTELGRLIVEQKLATSEEVQQCRDLLNQTGPDASQKTLAAVLVDHGVVTQGQIDRAVKTLEESRSQQIPGYKLLKKLGSGAMASVFLARQMSLDRLVAVKVLPRRLSESADYVQRFIMEGKAAAKLNHPNIVQAIDVGEAGGYHYFVMEYVQGRTLHDDLSKGPVYSEAQALDVIIQIARALEHAHEQGLIHRDVKPKNIMLTEDGMAKLADMGLARAVSDVEAAEAEAGRAFGTPYYISPEQIRGEVDIDFRADIYSLGATLYHLVTGRVPFEGPTPAAVMHKHLKEPLTPPDHINTNLSAGIGEVVEVMMAKPRNHRYASTSDLLLDLEAIAKGEPPLQARKQIDAKVLTGLALGEQSRDLSVELPEPQPAGNWAVYAVLLAVGLAVSVILNIVLLIAMARS